MASTLQGKFKPINPEKYKGDYTNILYRSSWEKMFMNWCDREKRVKRWQSEEKAIWYDHPTKKKKARYFPDFIVEYERSDGTTMTEVVEIKPQRQVLGPPENPKRKTQAWVKEVMTYMINQSKWKAARRWCEDRGYNFRIITEKELKLTYK